MMGKLIPPGVEESEEDIKQSKGRPQTGWDTNYT